jgi:hypothetical protein
MAISKVTTASITDADITTDKLAYDAAPFRNIIINGDMSQAQRGTSSSGNTTDVIQLDRMTVGISSSGTYTVSQDTDVPTGQGFAKSLKIDNTSATSGGTISVYQKIEGQNLQYLKKGTANAESITVSFWVKSNKTGTGVCELYDNDNTRQISATYTINSADTWEKKTITFAGDTTGALDNDNNLSMYCFIWFDALAVLQSGTLNTSWNSVTAANRVVGANIDLGDSTSNYANVTGFQMEAGTSASDFEFLPYDVNLIRCQRYYQKSYDENVNPGTATTSGKRSTSGHQGSTTTGYIEGDLPYTIRMRASPTITGYDDSGNSGKCSRLATGVDRYNNSNITFDRITNRVANIYSSSGTAANCLEVQYEANAEL